VGDLAGDLDEEWPVWRIVLSGRSLSDVDTWPPEDILKYNALLDMRDDFESAVNAWQNRDVK